MPTSISTNVRLRRRPAGHRRLRAGLPHRFHGGPGHRPQLPDGYPRLRCRWRCASRNAPSTSARWSRAPWSRTARGCRAPPSGSTRSRPPGTSAASSAGWTTTTPGWPPSGAILGQPRRHPRRRRPPLAETPGQRRSAAEHAPGTGSDDHGSRDPGRDRPGELVQSRRPRPCAAGQGRVHRRLRQADGGRPRATAGRPLPRLRRRPGPAHLPSRTERRLAQVLGRWRRNEPRRAPGGHRLARRDGIPGVLSAPQWGFYDVLFSHTSKDLATKPEDKRRFSFPRATAAT